MRLLLDECVPRKFKNNFPSHKCKTVPEAGFAGKENGELLSLAEQAGFEVFLTVDHGIEYEQNLTNRKVAVIVMHTKSSRLADLIPHVPGILKLLQSIRSGELTRVGG